jgi:cytochrome b6-f complex iron-sulfur subunit
LTRAFRGSREIFRTARKNPQARKSIRWGRLFSAMPSLETRDRRNVLNWLLGLWGGGVLGAVFYPVARYLSPPDIPEAAAVSATAGSARALLPNSGRVVPFGSRPAIVVRTPAGELRAFSATCTHLDCTVQYRSDLQRIWCACHNGQYDLNGRNIAGPPPRPLETYDVNLKDDEIVITRRS